MNKGDNISEIIQEHSQKNFEFNQMLRETHKNLAIQTRDFELKGAYYNKSFANGNKLHVVDELNKLHTYNSWLWGTVLLELNAEVKKFYKTRMRQA